MLAGFVSPIYQVIIENSTIMKYNRQYAEFHDNKELFTYFQRVGDRVNCVFLVIANYTMPAPPALAVPAGLLGHCVRM
jgi:hypothetical protein